MTPSRPDDTTNDRPGDPQIDGLSDRRSDPLSAAFDTLLDPRPGPMLGTAAAAEAAGCPAARLRIVPDRLLAAAVREGGAAVVLTHRLSVTLLRALDSHPVPLLVLTGALDPAHREALAALDGPGGTTLLGPGATLRFEQGAALLCAPEAGELEGLWRSLRGARLAVSPTPRWWWRLLDHGPARALPAAGYVPAAILDEAWARWAAAQGPDRVLVPLGVPSPPIDEPGATALAAAVAAHTLERWTGPVFPSPRVIASVLRGLRGSNPTPPDRSPDRSPDPGIWQQARRALPMLGATVGMEQARADLATDAATAAFLAQRALLRVDAARDALGRESPAPDDDEDGITRSGEVLRSAGEVLTDHESKVVLRGFGIEVTRQAVASSASGAAGFADRIGFPVALKALSPDLRRRAEIGAMQLSLRTAAAVRRAYAAIVDAVERNAPTARLDGVLVAEMVRPGLDLHCGAIRLPKGGLALFGRCLDASVPTEPVLAPAPLSHDEALLLGHAILARLPVPALRRRSDPDLRDLATVLLRLSALVERYGPRLDLVELRPVRLLERSTDDPTQDLRGYVTLDARIVQVPHLQGQ